MAKKPEATKSYITLTPIRHDGEDYARGTQIDLTEEQAQALLEVAAVKPFLSTPVPEPVVPQGSPDGGATA